MFCNGAHLELNTPIASLCVGTAYTITQVNFDDQQNWNRTEPLKVVNIYTITESQKSTVERVLISPLEHQTVPNTNPIFTV